jgi:uncharacterized protein YhfF
MLQEHKSVKEMWTNYLMSIGHDIVNTNKEYISWHFCDNEEDANNLAELVKQGIKRATTGLYYLYEIEGDTLPKDGDLNIIIDWQGKAQCIIETKKVTILPFENVTEEFAKIEGEGDMSLKYWQEVHINAFNRHLKNYKMKFSKDMLVVCEEFETVYK